MGTARSGSRRNPRHWVEFTGDRPPSTLSLLFWVAVAANSVALLRFADVSLTPGYPSPSTWAIALSQAGGLVLAGVLWPFLPWASTASRPRKGLTLLFLPAIMLVILTGGGAAVFMLFCLAVGNTILVFGSRSAIAYTAVTATLAVALFSSGPRADPWTGLFEGALLATLGLAMIKFFLSLLEARQRAEETRGLLADLEAAHAELRRYAERTRELTVAEERARMAREMHDSVGHYLTVINMGLANALRFRTARPDAAWDEVADAQRLTQEALADTRRWVRALKPLRLEGRAGPEAMRALAESFSGIGPQVVFGIDGAWPDTDEETELVCYRVLQEGITNALRHSAADRIEIDVTCTADRITVVVSDNGQGADDQAATHGFGLRELRERVEAVGGTMDAARRAGVGFAVRASVPARRASTPVGSDTGARVAGARS
ncbi:sensor histidine kinase [Nocardiopsis gilva YIM 90087]|uniref:histidine kinase n=1 Tax=Nocardiopsis gilva YIM 90087 TaxID=1235441 RepID=A0A223S4X3_9ACTN|nr:sensor histidine kinase [Nocardiopsis gilva]ASU83174.1 sensor histidine kinase [Nocardiopsis gilva YIM 90087]